MDNYIKSTTALIAEPSVQLWATELLYLADGQRDRQLQILGDASEYIKALWAEADNEIICEATFRQALEEFVIQWDPSVSEDAARLDIILSLIQAFRPPAGFGKIAGHLKTSNWFRIMYSPPISRSDSEPNDLHLKGLKVLESYFKTAPPQTTTAYQTYVHILATQLHYEPYRGYALARLLDLEEKTWHDPEVLEYIERSPEVLTEVIPVILRSHLLSVAREALGAFYAICISVEATDLFDEVIRRNGWDIRPELQEIIEDGRRRTIELPNPFIIRSGIAIPLNLSAAGMVEFVSDEPLLLEAEWLEDPELYKDQIADIVQQVIARSIEKLDGTSYGWKELTEDVNHLGVQLRVERPDQVFVRFSHSGPNIPLNLDQTTLETLLLIYTSEDAVEIERKLQAGATAGASA